MLNRIVPALGVIALASPAAMSQEIAKGVFLDGWADNIFTATDSGVELPAKGANNTVAFSTAAKIKIGWNVTDNVSGKVGVRFNNTKPGTSPNGTFNDPVYLQDSYVSVNWGNGVNTTMGKFINNIGWQAAEPVGLYRINVTPTANYYGNDAVGLSTGISKEGFTATALVTNGFFNNAVYNNATAPAKTNPSHSLGYGVDLTYDLPEKMGNVNLEFNWDPTSSATSDDIYQIGLNATIKPDDKTMVGGEVIYRGTVNGATDKKGKPTTREDLAWMLLANRALPDGTLPCPAAATVSVSQDSPFFNNYGTPDGAGGSTGHTTNEVAVALLTNPMGSTSFGLNFEVAHQWYDRTFKEAGSQYNADGMTKFSVEGLIAIP